MEQIKNKPFILSLDNVFVDIAIQLPDNTFITKHGLDPGG